MFLLKAMLFVSNLINEMSFIIFCSIYQLKIHKKCMWFLIITQSKTLLRKFAQVSFKTITAFQNVEQQKNTMPYSSSLKLAGSH